MFSKLMKYDFKAIGRIWWIAALGVLGVSLIGGISLSDIIINADNIDYFPFGIFGVMMTYMVFVAFGIITTVLLFIRYFKNFFTDEGYLTFTLPVKRSTLYWSKTVNAFIWYCLTGAIIVLSLLIVFFITPAPDESYFNLAFYLFYNAKEMLVSLYFDMGAWLYIYAALISVFLLLSNLLSVMLTHLCITVGAMLVKKAKVLVAIGLMYGVSGIISMFSMIFTFSFPSWTYSLHTVYASAVAGDKIFVFMALAMAFLCLAAVALCAFLSNVTLTCLERKLNLA